MLLMRVVLDRPDGPRFDAAMSYAAFQAPCLAAARGAGRAVRPLAVRQRAGKVSHYLWYKVAQRAARYPARELARALARAAEVDVALKSSRRRSRR